MCTRNFVGSSLLQIYHRIALNRRPQLFFLLLCKSLSSQRNKKPMKRFLANINKNQKAARQERKICEISEEFRLRSKRFYSKWNDVQEDWNSMKKSANIYSINYTLNSVSKMIFFFIPIEIDRNAIHFYANHMNHAYLISISCFFFNLKASISLLFSIRNAKSNWLSTNFPMVMMKLQTIARTK